MIGMIKQPIALQLYSLRAETRIDFIGTLRQIAAMGYGAVELRGTGDFTPTELKAILDDCGLQVAGSHVSLARLEQHLEQVIDETLTLNCGYIVCSKLPLGQGRYHADGWYAAARRFNAIGEICTQRGVQFCYHNHAFEFRRFAGKTALDILLEQTDPNLVKLELDIYWACYAGHDPATLIRRLTRRVPLLHLKDMRGRFWRTFTELGRGTIDIPAILSAAHDAGSVWCIVEQDRFVRPPLESMRLSLEYLRGLS